MKDEDLVSLITPCYNSSRFISKLLDSILGQDYPNIQHIIIDDGSTDNSGEIVKSYIEKYNKKGYALQYVKQSNAGQSYAIKSGLKLVDGEYLAWPDSDDYYSSSESISSMVRSLKDSGDTVSMVRVLYRSLDIEDGKVTEIGVPDDTRYKMDLFEDAIFGENGFWYPPGGYMAKMSVFKKVINIDKIYTEKNAGQNFQLYLPLLYKLKCVTIYEYLYTIVSHDDSHSRSLNTNNRRQDVYFRTIRATLNNIPLDKEYKTYLIKKIRIITDRAKGEPKLKARIVIKKLARGVIPYGIVSLYRRRWN